MSNLPTRAGGDHRMKTGKLAISAAVETAGAPTLSLSAAAMHLAGSAAAENRNEWPATAQPAVSAPQWVELLPAGTFHGRDGRGPFRLQEPAAVIAATQALGMGAGLPIDYDHATDFAAPEGRPAPAAGWIKALEVRGGAIWGRVEWTARAGSAIRAREYRYLSPVFQFDPADGRVTRLLRAGLTNNPNLYLTAIAAAKLSAAPHEEGIMEEFLSRLKELLDLDPNASFDDVLAAVGGLVNGRGEAAMDDARAAEAAAANAGAGDPARFVGVAEYQRALTELNALRAERARDRAALAVDEAMRAGKLSPAQREWAIAYCAADPRGFHAFAARQPALLAEDRSLGGEPRAQAGEVRVQLTATESAICAQLGVSSGEFLGRKNGTPDFLSLGRTAAEHDR
jgi:phage I-like protein